MQCSFGSKIVNNDLDSSWENVLVSMPIEKEKPAATESTTKHETL